MAKKFEDKKDLVDKEKKLIFYPILKLYNLKNLCHLFSDKKF